MMQFQYTPYIIPLIIAAAISGWVALYAWKRRSTPGAMWLSFMALAILEWSLGYALELAGANLATKLFWGKSQYLGIVAAPLTWLFFTYNYANKGKPLSRRTEMLLSIIPVITLILDFTTEYHGLVWKSVFISQVENLSTLGVTHGIWFWVHSAYSYIILLIGAIVIVRWMLSTQQLFRDQAIALLVAVLAPWVGNFLYLSGLSPIPNLDLTPFSFTLSTVALTWSIFGFRLIDLSPVAREIVIEEMLDGMIVIDAQRQIADINPAALRLIGSEASQAIGHPANEVLSFWPELFEKYKDALEVAEEISVGAGAAQRWHEMRLSPLYDTRKQLLGRVLTIRDITERKLSEARIEQLSRAVEASPTSIVITDTKGIIQYVNPKFTQTTGYTFAEALGKNPSILKTDQTPPEVHCQLWQTITSGQEWNGEFCNRKKNGELYWESASISPITDAAGRITHFVAVKEDITEKRLVQEQLRQQNEYLSILHQVALDLLNRRELGDLLVAIVDRAATLLDASYGEVMLKEGDDLVIRSTTKAHSYLLGERFTRNSGVLCWQAHNTGKPIIVDDYSTWPERRPVYEAMSLHAVAEFPVMAGEKCIAVLGLGRSQAGYAFKPDQIQLCILFSQLVALVLDNANLYDSALQEISDRKRAEALLQENEARYRQIVENASDIIYRTDINGYFTYANPVALKLLGFSQDAQIVGMNYLTLVVPEKRIEVKEFYRRQIINKMTNTYLEFPAYSSSGQEIWLGQNMQVIKEGSEIVGLQALARDITEVKHAQEALALARDQALEASRLKSQLLAKVSHELRTPLGGILGYAELLHSNVFGEISEQQRQATSNIIDSTQYLNTIINELLDEAQIEARKMTLRLDTCSPKEILQKVEGRMMVLAKNKGLALTTSISPDVPVSIIGDEQRLQQIFINLIGNAIKFTKNGNVNVDVGCPNPSCWEIRVSDSGEGIPQDALQSIFEPFRQVSDSITDDNRGAGLGLSITKQLVELMDGHILVKSELGRGSTFTVILPLDKKQENPV